MNHDHDWKPIDGMCGQYDCGCGATGYFSAFHGGIVEHKKRKRRNPRADVQERRDVVHGQVTRKRGAL